MNTKAQDYVEPAKSQISEKLTDMQNRMCDAANRVSDTARRASRATDRYVRDNPWQSIAVVAIAACMLGWLVSSSRD